MSNYPKCYQLVESPNSPDSDGKPWDRLLEIRSPDGRGPGGVNSEFGPGFQVAKFHYGSSRKDEISAGTYLVFNAEIFIPLKNPPADPAPHEAVVDAVIMAIADLPTMASYQEFIREMAPTRVTELPCDPAFPGLGNATANASGRTPAAVPTHPALTRILNTHTAADEVFWRLSAYESDRRITAQRGVTAGTFVTTDSDIEVVGSGLSAVGRYALPYPFPAIFAFRVLPNRGTPITIGTARPNFGQAGGGVEAVFEKATKPWCVANHIRVLPAW